MKIGDHAFTDGTVSVLVSDDNKSASIIMTERPGPDKTDDVCDTALIATKDPADLLALAGTCVRAAALIMPPARAARGPRPANLGILAAFAAELEALKLVDGAGI